MAKATFNFPKGFLWGTTTAAHQVEGGNTQNDWWHWEQKAGHIQDGATSAEACDWWENAEEYADCMQSLGQNAHRMSVEWSRIQPREDQWDEVALARYREILAGMRDRGIKPMVTLHHYTNPQWFAERGGWENRSLALESFPRYVEKVVGALGDLTDLWCTFNEPNNYVLMGWMWGRWPPGKAHYGRAVSALRTILHSHAAAYHLIHELRPDAQVGLSTHLVIFDPANPDSFLDRLAARWQDTMFNQASLSALSRGRLPLRTRRPFMGAVKGTFDWIGVNYFFRRRVAFDIRQNRALFSRLVVPEGADTPVEGMGETYPQGLLRLARRLSRLGKPIYITENGVHDLTGERRPRFLLTHLDQLWHAINFNFPIRGYFYRTLVDCFEWDAGYGFRYGLIKRDHKTGQRTMRPSAELYRDVCCANALDDEIVARYDPELADHLFRG
jgi:beta-glucosidase